jgi:DNA-binding response OmpR family regulator
MKTFPLSKVSYCAIFRECNQMTKQNRRIKILVIEDEPDTAEMIAEMMRISGYDVVKYDRSTTALARFKQEQPDAVILDVMMPELSGLEVLRKIRSETEHRTLPIIVVSALGLSTDIQDGLAAGATMYLTKPVSYEDLKQAVEQVTASAEKKS